MSAATDRGEKGIGHLYLIAFNPEPATVQGKKGGPTDVGQELDLALLEEVRRHGGKSPDTLLGKLLDGDPAITHVPWAATRNFLNKRRTLKRQGEVSFVPLPDHGARQGNKYAADAKAFMSQPPHEGPWSALRRWAENPLPTDIPLTSSERRFVEAFRQTILKSKGSEELAPLSRLAEQAGISPSTMTRALKKLRRSFQE